MTRRILSLVSAALWLAVGVAAFVALLNPQALGSDDPAFLIWVAVVVVPPIAIGVGCLFLRGGWMVALGVAAAVVAFMHLFVIGFGTGSTTEQIWAYLVLAAVGVGLVWAIWAGIDRIRHPERAPAPPDPVAELEAAHAAGTVTEAMFPFELARVHLYQTGNRRLFTCGRCGKGISLAWKKCDHCGATFDEFPPIATGEEVKAEPDVVQLLTDL